MTHVTAEDLPIGWGVECSVTGSRPFPKDVQSAAVSWGFLTITLQLVISTRFYPKPLTNDLSDDGNSVLSWKQWCTTASWILAACSLKRQVISPDNVTHSDISMTTSKTVTHQTISLTISLSLYLLTWDHSSHLTSTEAKTSMRWWRAGLIWQLLSYDTWTWTQIQEWSCMTN